MSPWPLSPDLLRAVEKTKADYFTQRALALIELGSEIKVGRFGHATAFLWPDYNRVYGFNADDLPRLADLIDWYAEEEETPVFDILPLPDNKELLRELSARGFNQTRFQSVLVGRADADLPQPVDVRWIGSHETGTWAQLYIDSYDWKLVGEELRDELVAQYTGPQWRLCIAEIDGSPCGVGALYLGKEIAYLANAATLPDLRGRGGQRSLIAFRTAAAAKEGYAVVAGDCSPYGPSQRNLERCGLRLACQKAVWAKGV